LRDDTGAASVFTPTRCCVAAAKGAGGQDKGQCLALAARVAGRVDIGVLRRAGRAQLCGRDCRSAAAGLRRPGVSGVADVGDRRGTEVVAAEVGEDARRGIVGSRSWPLSFRRTNRRGREAGSFGARNCTCMSVSMTPGASAAMRAPVRHGRPGPIATARARWSMPALIAQ
jgi:hypothetical protein